MDKLDLDSLVTSTVELTGDWSEWIHRRVESLEFIDERRLSRRVSIDFVVPEQAVCIESPSSATESFAIPLGLFRKGALRRFDVADETGRTLPLLTRSQTAEVDARLLVGAAIAALQDAGYNKDLDPDIASDLRRLAMSFWRRDGRALLETFFDAESVLIGHELQLRGRVAQAQADRLTHDSDPSLPSPRQLLFGGNADIRARRLLGEAVGIASERLNKVTVAEIWTALGRSAKVPEVTIQRALLAIDRNARPLMTDLADNYLLFVQVPGSRNTRRIVKYAYESEEITRFGRVVSLVFRTWSAVVTLLAGFGVHRVTIAIPNLSRAGSFHVEASSHAELFISRAQLIVKPPRMSSAPSWIAGVPETTAGEGEPDSSASTAVEHPKLDPSPTKGAPKERQPADQAEASMSTSRSAQRLMATSPSEGGVMEEGPAPFIHLYASQSDPGVLGRLRLEICLEPGGLLSAGAFIAGLVFLLLLTGARLHALGFSRSGDTAAAVIIAAAGVFAGYLFRPGEHRFVRRFLRELRFDTAVLTGLTFASAGLLAVNWPARSDAWTLITFVAFVLFLRRTSAWMTAEAIRRDFLPVQWVVRLIWSTLRLVGRVLAYPLRRLGVGVAKRQLWAAVVALVLINLGVAAAFDWAVQRSVDVHFSGALADVHVLEPLSGPSRLDWL